MIDKSIGARVLHVMFWLVVGSIGLGLADAHKWPQYIGAIMFAFALLKIVDLMFDWGDR